MEYTQIKEQIKSYQAEITSIREHIMSDFISFLDSIMKESGEVLLNKEGELFYAPYTYFTIRHLNYNKEDKTVKAHIENCAQELPFTSLPVEDILAVFNKLYQK